MRDIINVSRCHRCKTAVGWTVIDRDLDDEGEERVSVWREALPAHDCEAMIRLFREIWPAHVWDRTLLERLGETPRKPE